jgi:hypothetical protein
MNGDFELDADIKALLRSERAFSEIPDSGRARLSRRLRDSVGAFGAGSHVSVHSVTKLAVKGWSGLVVKGAIVALAGGALVMHATQTESPESFTSVATPAQTRDAPHAMPIEQPVLTMPVPSAVPSPISMTPVQQAKRTLRPLSDDVELAEEQRLLDEARDAMARGEPERALDATAQHAARFARGRLTEERFAIRIRALARLGRRDEAEALLTAMRNRYPHSFLLDGATRDVDGSASGTIP